MKLKSSIQQPKPTSLVTTILIILLTITLLILITTTIYIFYSNTPGKPQELNIHIPTTEQPLLPTNQFYQNMKFNHNDITYKIDSKCSQEKTQRVLQAFNEITLKIPQIIFISTSGTPDIRVSCSQQDKDSSKEDFFIAG